MEDNYLVKDWCGFGIISYYLFYFGFKFALINVNYLNSTLFEYKKIKVNHKNYLIVKGTQELDKNIFVNDERIAKSDPKRTS